MIETFLCEGPTNKIAKIWPKIGPRAQNFCVLAMRIAADLGRANNFSSTSTATQIGGVGCSAGSVKHVGRRMVSNDDGTSRTSRKPCGPNSRSVDRIFVCEENGDDERFSRSPHPPWVHTTRLEKYGPSSWCVSASSGLVGFRGSSWVTVR